MCSVIQIELVTGSSGDPLPDILCLYVVNLLCEDIKTIIELKGHLGIFKSISRNCHVNVGNSLGSIRTLTDALCRGSGCVDSSWCRESRVYTHGAPEGR